MAYPPEITRLEHNVREHGGSTFRTELNPDALQSQKQTPDLKTRLVEVLRENGRLKQELAEHKACLIAMAIHWEKTQTAIRLLQDSSMEVLERTELAEAEFLRDVGIPALSASDVIQI